MNDTVSVDSPPADETIADGSISDAHEREGRMERIVSMLNELEGRFSGLEAGQSGLVARIDSFGQTLDAVAARQPPRPDVSDFNRGIARVTTALNHTLRRVEDSLGEISSGSSKNGADVAGSLSTGLSALAEAVRATQGGHSGTASELAMISSMQETLSHQLAKLLEASQAQRVPVMEEFLLDVRHATAELLAEQARVSKAG